MRWLFLLGWLLTAFPSLAEIAAAPEVVDSTSAIRPATATAFQRAPDAAQYARLRDRSDLHYRPPGYKPSVSAWERFWTWLWERVDSVFSSSAAGRTFTWLWYVFLIGMLTWVVLKTLKIDLTAAFKRAPRQAPAYDVTLAESPFTDDLAARLADAEARGDYRLAVRLSYLMALRQLADRDLIHWLPDKTNTHYLRELPAGPLREAFAPLTRAFEEAWYGDFTPTSAEYSAFRDARAALSNALPAALSAAATAHATASTYASAPA